MFLTKSLTTLAYLYNPSWLAEDVKSSSSMLCAAFTPRLCRLQVTDCYESCKLAKISGCLCKAFSGMIGMLLHPAFQNCTISCTTGCFSSFSKTQLHTAGPPVSSVCCTPAVRWQQPLRSLPGTTVLCLMKLCSSGKTKPVRPRTWMLYRCNFALLPALCPTCDASLVP